MLDNPTIAENQAKWSTFRAALFGRAGHIKFSVNNLLAARQVLPIWERTFSDNTLLAEIIEFTELFLADKLPATVISENYEAFDYDERYLGLDYKWTWSEAGYALSTVYEMMNVVFSRSRPFQYLNPEKLEQGIPDELCHRVGDVVSNAVLANSGINPGTPTNPLFSPLVESKQGPYFKPEKRRQFWEWWLTQVIPQAWHLANS